MSNLFWVDMMTTAENEPLKFGNVVEIHNDNTYLNCLKRTYEALRSIDYQDLSGTERRILDDVSSTLEL